MPLSVFSSSTQPWIGRHSAERVCSMNIYNIFNLMYANLEESLGGRISDCFTFIPQLSMSFIIPHLN